jgi:(R,R)-butanediol dehydrogenase/meso-butanediol dehydrogenase/diacetyl reductase
MRALRFHSAKDVHLDEVPTPPAPIGTQVLIAPMVTGICGSDVHEYADGPILTSVTPHPVTGGHLPQILGHEFAGTVVDVGPDVSSVSPGARISVMPLISCGDCAACLDGQEQFCDLRGVVGVRHPWGGMADLALIDEAQANPIPDALTWEQGALIEPAAVSWSAVQVGAVAPGQTVLVTGAGPIGALAALAAASAGAEVLISEPSPSRARLAEGLGFPVIDPRDGDVAAQCRERFGEGVHVAIECSGQEVAIRDALAALRPGGRVVQTGVPPALTTLELRSLMMRGLSIVGSVGYPLRCWPTVIEEVVSGRYPVERVISGKVTLDTAVRLGFDRMLDPDGGAVKVLIDVGRLP